MFAKEEGLHGNLERFENCRPIEPSLTLKSKLQDSSLSRKQSIISQHSEIKKSGDYANYLTVTVVPIILRRGRKIEVVYFRGNKLKWSVRYGLQEVPDYLLFAS
ncbi:hypothetical protein APICC_00011 [Apis cerana cerana]|uniref:Uncharacterized protein n=1 Tax=Apis cerana cerana TaxID=94128 RepID=A0A2A3EUK6_APICC|nr:hypothetical protein APICC_00011 [Apis cerana cerana]